MIEAKVIADSISEEGKRITTMQVKFHRFILPEFNTHRVFSRNFSSSRAIPTTKLIEQVRKDPATPVFWGKNQAGMQAEQELTGEDKAFAQREWRIAAHVACDSAETMNKLGVHKQITNRLIEPFLWSTGIVTSTEWDNFFDLRAHKDAQPEIQELALAMAAAMSQSTPKLLKPGEWHLPYITKDERNDQYFKQNPELLKQISVARCCRVSYLKHDGSIPNITEDLKLFERLVGAVPQHMSPCEHQASPDILINKEYAQKLLHGNLKGWIQYRSLVTI